MPDISSIFTLIKSTCIIFALTMLTLVCSPVNADSNTWQAIDAQNNVWLQNITSRVETQDGSFSLSDSRYRLSKSQLPSDDAFDANPWTVVDAIDTESILDLRLYYRQGAEGRLVSKLWCRNRSSKPVHINRFVVVDGMHNGSWEGGRVLQFGTGNAQLMQKDKPLGGFYATASNKPSLAGGFLSTQHYIGIVTVIPVDDGLRVIAENPADGVLLKPGAERESETVWLSPASNPSTELERWANLAGKWNNVQLWDKNFATWCSWYSGLTFANNEDGNLEKTTLANIPVIAEKLLPYGLECMRVVDDSIYRKSGDWPLATNALPSGYQSMVDAMKKASIRPGYWYDINRVSVSSVLFKEHPNWLAKDTVGNPVIYGVDSEYCSYGLLDASLPQVQEHYNKITKRFSDIGMQYCFTDFIGESIVPPSQSHNPEMTGVEVSRKALESIRKGFNGDFYWLSQQTPAANIGLADAMRTGGDSFGGEISSYTDAVSKWFMNRRLLLCDPDSWCPLLHTEQWDRDWGSYLALTGYAMTIGGDMRNLTREREKIMQRLLPALNSTGRPRDIWERETPIVLEQSFSCGDENWRVIGLFNWKDVTVDVKLNLDRIWDESKFPIQGQPAKQSDVGETNRRYLLFDFWNQRILGMYTGNADFTLPAKSGKVIVVREAWNRPQILAIGEHIGQGVEELVDTHWAPKIQTLTGTTRGRRGIMNTYVRLFIAPGWKIRSVAINGKSISWEEYLPDMYRFEVPDKNGPVTWIATFDGSPYEEFKPRPVNTALIAETSIDPESVKNLWNNMPEIWKSGLPGESRYMRNIPDGYDLAFYACAEGIFGDKYNPVLGFGIVNANTFVSPAVFKLGLPLRNWFDEKAVIYRIDKLSPDITYKVGVTIYDVDSANRKVDIALKRVSDGKESIIASDVVEPRLINGSKPSVVWREIPKDMIDPNGLHIEVRRKDGANAVCAEIWIAKETSDEDKIDPTLIFEWKNRLQRHSLNLIGNRYVSEMPSGYDLKYFVRAQDEMTDVLYSSQRGYGRLFGTPYIWNAPSTVDKIRFDAESVEYRFDKLQPDKKYRIGILSYDDSVDRKINIAVKGISDKKETTLLKDQPIKSNIRKENPSIIWIDLPKESIDAKGTVIVIQNASGPNAVMAEIWVVEKK